MPATFLVEVRHPQWRRACFLGLDILKQDPVVEPAVGQGVDRLKVQFELLRWLTSRDRSRDPAVSHGESIAHGADHSRVNDEQWGHLEDEPPVGRSH